MIFYTGVYIFFFPLVRWADIIFLILPLQAAGSLSLGLGEESISASSVLVMPMVSSRTTGFRETTFDRTKFIPLRNSRWSSPSIDDNSDDDVEIQASRSLLS